MALAKCYLVFCGQQTPTFTYQTKSQSTFATKGKAFCALHRNPCRAHITINDFQGGKCAKIFSGFCCCKCSPSPTKPSRQALLPHFLRFLESPTCTQVEQHHIFNENVLKNAHQAQHRAEEEVNGKSEQTDCILPYSYPHVVHQSLHQEDSRKIQLTN